jgi:hypothetical protein
VGGGNSIALQKSIINYNDSSLGSSYINSYTRAFGTTNINTVYYKNNFFFTGYSPGSTIQTCFFTVDNEMRFNGGSIQPIQAFGNLPTSPVQLRVGSQNNSTSGLISISTIINISISPDTMQLIRKIFKDTLGKDLNLPY